MSTVRTILRRLARREREQPYGAFFIRFILESSTSIKSFFQSLPVRKANNNNDI